MFSIYCNRWKRQSKFTEYIEAMKDIPDLNNNPHANKNFFEMYQISYLSTFVRCLTSMLQVLCNQMKYWFILWLKNSGQILLKLLFYIKEGGTPKSYKFTITTIKWIIMVYLMTNQLKSIPSHVWCDSQRNVIQQKC